MSLKATFCLWTPHIPGRSLQGNHLSPAIWSLLWCSASYRPAVIAPKWLWIYYHASQCIFCPSKSASSGILPEQQKANWRSCGFWNYLNVMWDTSLRVTSLPPCDGSYQAWCSSYMTIPCLYCVYKAHLILGLIFKISVSRVFFTNKYLIGSS